MKPRNFATIEPNHLAEMDRVPIKAKGKVLSMLPATLDPVTSVRWRSCAVEPPDDDTTVLVYDPTASEPVWPGYKSGEDWRWAEGPRIHNPRFWCHIPTFPA
jgi:hypothetical protein